MKISIAMATYNGARYLREQLDSLAKQKRLPNELVVCDDGSIDETLTILEHFAAEAPFPVRVYRNQRNLGFANNFVKVAQLCECDWIAFCDQDDVWLPNKLADCAEIIEKNPDLVLVLQNATICDADLRSRGQTFPNRIRAGIYGPNEQYGLWVWVGFLSTLRAALVQELDPSRRPPNYFSGHAVQSHDKWSCMVANALGGIAVLPQPAALYRRHESALTGDYRNKSLGERLPGSLGVGEEHYRFLSNVAVSSAKCLERLAAETSRPSWAKRFTASSVMFRKFSKIQTARARLYKSASSLGRLRALGTILLSGGYFGRPFVAMGLRSFAKDVAVALLGVRLQQEERNRAHFDSPS